MDAPVAVVVASPADTAMAALRSLRGQISFAGAALLVLDPVTHLPCTGAVDALPEATCHPFFAFEVGEDAHTFRRLALDRRISARVSVEETPQHSFVESVLQPHGFGSELRAVCRSAQAVWGGITLFRRRGSRPFGDAEQDRLGRIADGVGERLRDSIVSSLGRQPVGDVPTLLPGTLGVLLVEDGEVTEASPEVAGMLAELDHPAADEYRHVDHLRALASGPLPFTTVLRTPRGWLTAHGTALSRSRVAIALSAAGPERLLGPRVVAAGLSAREVEVTRLLCRGLSDREIARDLGVSEHTAHDHVRAVRRKLGVRSRAEVSATIFAERYFEEFVASASMTHR